MFVNTEHLPQVLPPEGYTSREQYEREMHRLFLPNWQFIGTLSEMPDEGDYITFELFGRPLIVWRQEGEVHAFLNVCPHRFSMLSEDPCGHAEGRLKCRYHGWEFDKHGDTRKIPDARSFRPMERGELGLKKYPAETCGQLIFVKLTEDGPSLREWLGPGYEVGEELFGEDRRQFASFDYEVACNWKIKIENSLESYHVDFVHPNTFRKTPEADICFHELEPTWTSYTTTQEATKAADRFLNRLIHKVAEKEDDGKYQHFHYFPSMMYGKMSLFSFAETVFPLSADRTRILAKFFCYPGPAGRVKSRILGRCLGHWGRKFFNEVAREDVSVMPGIQKGMESDQQPSRGLISVREERLFSFQEYVMKQTIGQSDSQTIGSRPCSVRPTV